MNWRKIRREAGLEAALLLVGIPLLLWTLIPIYHTVLFAISPRSEEHTSELQSH